MHKVHQHDLNLISDLTETSNWSEETHNIDSPILIFMANIMSRTGSINKFNKNNNKNLFFENDHIMPKEDYTTLSPEIKDFWNSIPNKEKASI